MRKSRRSRRNQFSRNEERRERGGWRADHQRLRFSERAEIIREKGTNRAKFLRGEIDKYTWVDVGSSYLPSEIVAAFLYAQLQRIDQINAVRRGISTGTWTRSATSCRRAELRFPPSPAIDKAMGTSFIC